MAQIVVVTGASGFLGSHIVKAALDEGFSVRACVREPSDAARTEHLTRLDPSGTKLKLYKADLLQQGSYDEACAGAYAVIHAAAVVEVGHTKDPQREIVDPSVEGVKNVLASISKSGTVKQLVHTSSVAAIHQRQKPSSYVHTEKDWNTEYPTLAIDPYGLAKTQAELLVWKWAKEHAGVTVNVCNPAVVLGPVMNKAHTKTSTVFMREAVYNNKVLPYWANFVDVRDVALAHVRCLKSGTGSRYILASDAGCMRPCDLGAIAQKELPQYRLSTPPKYPNWLVTLLVWLSLIPIIGRFFLGPFNRSGLTWKDNLDNSKAKKELGIAFRPLSTTVKDGVMSIIDGGYAKPKKR